MGLFDFAKRSNSKGEINKSAISNNNGYISVEPNEREFDLNIEKILENWEVYHAVREIISNALDEQIITGTADISIFCDNRNNWHIVDYGRGLNYHHLTQNENEEKLQNDKLIGRFGVGLKDALATFYRHGINVTIKSKYGIITLKQAAKSGFEDIVTLHAEIMDSDDPKMVGTDFCLDGCTNDDIEKAKALFLKFSKEEVLESTRHGDVLKRIGESASIYINGVKVAEESNFLFSYNITLLNTKIKRALNRERTAVGRTAYTDSVKNILLNCESEAVISDLTDDLQRYEIGTKHDELNWNDVILHATSELGKKQSNAVFVTPEELMESPSVIDEIIRSGKKIITIPSNIANKINEQNKNSDSNNKIQTTSWFVAEQKERFNPIIIKRNELTPREIRIYDRTDDILKLIGGKPSQVLSIEITDKLYEFGLSQNTVVGLWQPQERRILIKRTQLGSLSDYAGTLLHECAHAISGADDVSRDFERKLTEIIGKIASDLINSSHHI